MAIIERPNVESATGASTPRNSSAVLRDEVVCALAANFIEFSSMLAIFWAIGYYDP